MNKSVFFATFFIAACAISTGAIGQKVYRCGGSYSDVPCPGAIAVDAQDPRTKTQKAEADATTARESAAANTLEKDRLKQEAKELAENKAAAKNAKKTAAKSKSTKTKPQPDANSSTAAEVVAEVGTKKHSAKKKKATEYFTAQSNTEQKTKAAEPVK